MSTLHWSDDKRRHGLVVDELKWRRYELGRERNLILRSYFDAASIPDLAERRRVRADLGRRLKAVGKELHSVQERYYSAAATLQRMA